MSDVLIFTDDYGPSGSSRYWMYLAINEYFEGFAPAKPLIQLLTNFGKDLGADARAYLPASGSYSKTRRSILNRAWPVSTWEELDRKKTPYLLILNWLALVSLQTR